MCLNWRPLSPSQGNWSLREFDGQDSHAECLDSTQWWDNILSIICIDFLLFWYHCCSKWKTIMFGEDFSLPPLQTWWSPLLCLLSSGCENPRLWNSSRPPGTAQQPTPFTLLINPYSSNVFAQPFSFSNFLIFLETYLNTNKSSGEWALLYLKILRLGTWDGVSAALKEALRYPSSKYSNAKYEVQNTKKLKMQNLKHKTPKFQMLKSSDGGP